MARTDGGAGTGGARIDREPDRTDFADYRLSQRWFRRHRPEASIAMAVRAALRALPMIVAARDEPHFYRANVLAAFRAPAVALVAARYPRQRWGLRHLLADAASIASLPETMPRAAAARHMLDAAHVAADAAAAADVGAFYAAARAVSACRAAAALAPAIGAATSTVTAVAADAEAIDSRLDPAELATRPLWPEQTPGWAALVWADLTEVLRAAHANWSVWIDWYEDRLAGRPSFGEEIDVAIARLPIRAWMQEPKVVNARIRRLIGKAQVEKAG